MSMLQIFLAVIVSGLLLLITAVSLLVLPDGATATLVNPLPRYSVARIEKIESRLAGQKMPLVQAGGDAAKVDTDKITTGSIGQRVSKKESRPW